MRAQKLLGEDSFALIASENKCVDVMKDSCSACGGQHTRYCFQEKDLNEHEPIIPPVNRI